MAILIAADSVYAELPAHTALNLGRFTVTGWWRVDDFGAPSPRPMWALGGAGVDRVYMNPAFYAANQLSFSTILAAGPTGESCDGTLIPRVAEWFHLANIIDLTGNTDHTNPRQFINGKPDHTTVGGGAATKLALPTAPAFRVGTDFAANWFRGATTRLRVYSGDLTARDLQDDMLSRVPPARLRSRCLVDLPLTGDFVNQGRLGGAMAVTGSITFTSGPNVGQRPTRRPTLLGTPPGSLSVTMTSGIDASMTVGAPTVQLLQQLIMATGIDASFTVGTPTFPTIDVGPIYCATLTATDSYQTTLTSRDSYQTTLTTEACGD